MKRFYWFAFILFLLIQSPPAALSQARHRVDRILVKPLGGPIADLHAAARSRVLRTWPRFGNLQVVEIRPGATVTEVVAQYRDSGRVQYAEPDLIYTLGHHNNPNDPKYVDGTAWGLHNTGQNGGSNDADVDAPEAWHYRCYAPETIVAVIDTGVRYTHEDLSQNMWRNPGEIPANSVDDDANGYVDDVYGINALTGSGNPNDDDFLDGHGTHVAGIVGAVGNNGLGVIGAAWRVQIMACKAVSATSQITESDVIECINYAIDKGAHIINASFGGTDFAQALEDAIRVAGNAGIIFVAIAHNFSSDVDSVPNYPASYDQDNIVVVLSTTRTDAKATSSSFGVVSVDLGAPGQDILSTGRISDSYYFTTSGTSMAAPLVSGAFALMKAQFPSESYSQLINRVLSNTDQLSSLAGKCQTAGRLNLHRALTSSSTRPPNDSFASAIDGFDRFKIVIPSSGSITATGNNVDASKETSEPNHAANFGGKSIWWRWTAPNTLPVTIKTKGSSFNTLLGVYVGTSVNSLTQIASSAATDGCSFSQVTFTPAAGTTYRIAIDGYNGAFGTVKLTLQTSGDTSTYPVKFQPTSLQRPSGQFRADLTGPFSTAVTIESSSDLETWTPRGTFNFSPSGNFTYTDTAASVSLRVYRAKTATALSCNAVGYQDQLIQAGPSKMIANPFNAVDNRVSALLPSAPGMTLYKWDDVTDSYIYNEFVGSWSLPNMTLAPGEGVIASTTTSQTLTFLGVVLQGHLENSIPSGYSIRASKYPKTDLIGSLGFPIGNGDTITKYINGTSTEYTFHNGIWTPVQPLLAVGESFWINKKTDWKQIISLWP